MQGINLEWSPSNFLFKLRMGIPNLRDAIINIRLEKKFAHLSQAEENYRNMPLNFHDIALRLQRHFSDGLVTVIGSGLSCAEGLPGMGALALHLEQSIGPNLAESDIELWNEILPSIKLVGLEAALLAKAPTEALEIAISSATADLILKHEKEVLNQVFTGSKTLRFSMLLRQMIKSPSGIPIITTNYDRLVEIAVEEAGLGVDTMFVGQFAGVFNEKESRHSFCRDVTLRKKQVNRVYRDRVNLYKPHGSLDWYHRAGKPVRYSGDLNAPRLIITPGLNKFRNGYESPFDRHRERANQAIDEATRFLIIGYGFNDQHLETHLTPMIKSGKPTLLLTYSLSDNAKSLAELYNNVMALESYVEDGKSGTKVTIERETTFLPEMALWDVDQFVRKVLQP